LTTWKYDGGRDVHKAFALSGEDIAPQITVNYGNEPFREMTASEIASTNIAKRMYQKEYMDYWNSTSSSTDSGQPVDAVILPLAPFAAARPGLYDYHGMLLDMLNSTEAEHTKGTRKLSICSIIRRL
jgi:amidase